MESVYEGGGHRYEEGGVNAIGKGKACMLATKQAPFGMRAAPTPPRPLPPTPAWALGLSTVQWVLPSRVDGRS